MFYDNEVKKHPELTEKYRKLIKKHNAFIKFSTYLQQTLTNSLQGEHDKLVKSNNKRECAYLILDKIQKSINVYHKSRAKVEALFEKFENEYKVIEHEKVLNNKTIQKNKVNTINLIKNNVPIVKQTKKPKSKESYKKTTNALKIQKNENLPGNINHTLISKNDKNNSNKINSVNSKQCKNKEKSTSKKHKKLPNPENISIIHEKKEIFTLPAFNSKLKISTKKTEDKKNVIILTKPEEYFLQFLIGKNSDIRKLNFQDIFKNFNRIDKNSKVIGQVKGSHFKYCFLKSRAIFVSPHSYWKRNKKLSGLFIRNVISLLTASGLSKKLTDFLRQDNFNWNKHKAIIANRIDRNIEQDSFYKSKDDAQQTKITTKKKRKNNKKRKKRK